MQTMHADDACRVTSGCSLDAAGGRWCEGWGRPRGLACDLSVRGLAAVAECRRDGSVGTGCGAGRDGWRSKARGHTARGNTATQGKLYAVRTHTGTTEGVRQSSLLCVSVGPSGHRPSCMGLGAWARRNFHTRSMCEERGGAGRGGSGWVRSFLILFRNTGYAAEHLSSRILF